MWTATVYLCGELGFEGNCLNRRTEKHCAWKKIIYVKQTFCYACGQQCILCSKDKHVSREDVVLAQNCYDHSASGWCRNITMEEINCSVHCLMDWKAIGKKAVEKIEIFYQSEWIDS